MESLVDGVPPPGDATSTVAVYVTDSPTTDGLAEEETSVEVAAGSTLWSSAGEFEEA
jgi:hypothetical protein